jgi:Asp/Glu/hydantoin racemase
MLCDGAFDILMGGDREAHDQLVVDQAMVLAKDVDVIVLAQASMQRLKQRLHDQTGLPVLSSPRMGVEHLAQIVLEQTA